MMSVPMLAAIGSIGVGALLAWPRLRGARVTRVVETTAVVVTLVLVVGQMLPEVLSEAGFWGVVVFFATLGVPRVFEWMGQRRKSGPEKNPEASLDPECTAEHSDHHHHHHPTHRVGLELMYGGLLFHRFLDGVGLGTYDLGVSGETRRWEMVVAIAVHTVPVTAAALFTLGQHVHSRAAHQTQLIARALGLVLATGLGIHLVDQVPSEWVMSVGPWIHAGVAGMLLHVVLHDWLVPHGKPTSANPER